MMMFEQGEIDLKQDVLFKHDFSSYIFKKFTIIKEACDRCREEMKGKKPVELDLEETPELS